MKEKVLSREYVEHICNMYGDVYDDRLEDCRPPAAGDEFRDPEEDWKPGPVADYKSFAASQKELENQEINLSSSKIRKILITNGCWTTKRSREVAELFEYYTSPIDDGSKGLSRDVAVKMIAEKLNVSIVTVSVNLPYLNVVYKLENRRKNAKCYATYEKRKRQRMNQE